MQMFDSRYHRAVVRQTGRRTDGRTNTQSALKNWHLVLTARLLSLMTKQTVTVSSPLAIISIVGRQTMPLFVDSAYNRYVKGCLEL